MHPRVVRWVAVLSTSGVSCDSEQIPAIDIDAR